MNINKVKSGAIEILRNAIKDIEMYGEVMNVKLKAFDDGSNESKIAIEAVKRNSLMYKKT